MTIATRFPPSPTGDLHIGSVRTALYNYLFARQQEGRFVFRLEDTDRERSTEQAVQNILAGMSWLGLDYDEGPHYQTARFARYEEKIAELKQSGHAYKCYCTKQRLDALRDEQVASQLTPKYDGHCRGSQKNNHDKSGSFVMRLKTPVDGHVIVRDEIRGDVKIENSQLDDLIIARSDGTPTYHLTVVVDDIDMEISHVIRGDDHLSNTARQIHIINALNAQIPVYAHIPMINGTDGKRLSKRHGAVSVLEYRDNGILPEALLNYLARLGWSHGDQEIFSMDEMRELFSLSAVNKSAAAFDPDKLLWVNQQYIQSMEIDRLASYAAPFFLARGLDIEEREKFVAVVDAQRTRVKDLMEMADKSAAFFGKFSGHEESAVKKHLRGVVAEPLQVLRERLSELEDWSPNKLQAIVEQVAEERELKLGKIAQPLRVAVTGGSASPGIEVTLWLVGREQCLERLDIALQLIRDRVSSA
jgi:glutamyl-tRNA synthetase